MQVLHIVADGNPGGGTTHVLHVLHSLADTYTSGVVTQTNSYLLREVQARSIQGFGVDFFRHRLNPALPRQVRHLVQQFAPDIIHMHGGRAGLWTTLAATGFPTIYTVHGFHFLHKPWLMRRLAIMAERLIIRRATRTIFVSHYDVRIARAFRLTGPRQHPSVIYNGIALPACPHAAAGTARHIGFVGRLEHQKDPGLFVEVMAHLPDYTAVMAGGGALAAEVRAEIARRGMSDRIQMLGPLTHDDTLQVLPGLSAVVMTSRWEGLPLVPLEAMWYGVPVVAVDVGGISEIMEHGRHGMLVRSRSALALAAAVRTVTEDLAVRERIVQQARSRMQALFSVEKMAASLRQVYDQVATQPPVRRERQ